MTKQGSIRVRFAPSPTGDPHIGSVRTALYNWLFAKHLAGTFVVRIEDTDRERFVPESIATIFKALTWLGLEPDESPRHGGKFGPYQQSERLELYRQYAHQLIANGRAYYCFCTTERLETLRQTQKNTGQPTRYDSHCLRLPLSERERRAAAGEPHVIRLQVPEQGSTVFHDVVRGEIMIDNNQIDHQVLLKSDGFPTYHLANVVDDHLMRISHVIRAEEWLPSTPKHLLLYQAFGWPPPQFAHVSLIIGSDRTKLSKRHGAVSILDYQKQGYVPEALLSFLALLGWNPKTDQEVFRRAELVKAFTLAGLNKAPAIFNLEKLNAMNAKLVRLLSDTELVAETKPFLQDYQHFDQTKLVSLFHDRVEHFDQLPDLLGYLIALPPYDSAMLIPKQGSVAEAKAALNLSRRILSELKVPRYDEEKLREVFFKALEEEKQNRGLVLWPLRVAVTGQKQSPDVFASIAALGKKETLVRIDSALAKL